MKNITCALTILMLMIMLCACGNDAGTGGAAMGAAISGTYAPQLEAASTDASEIAQTEAANVPAESAALTETTQASKSAGIDIDLTALSSTMVYSEVYNMMVTPENYIGKTVKMRGQLEIAQPLDADGNPDPQRIYFSCVIADATACCAQGIEFVLAGEHKYPARKSRCPERFALMKRTDISTASCTTPKCNKVIERKTQPHPRQKSDGAARLVNHPST